MVPFDLAGPEVALHDTRQDAPPKMLRIDHAVVSGRSENDQRPDLPLRNSRKGGTIHNTPAGSVRIAGPIARRGRAPRALVGGYLA